MGSKNFNVPLSEPYIKGSEWKYIKECLDTGWVSSVGSFVNRFEEAVARYVGAKYAVAVVNGTSALHLGLIASGSKPGDEVLVPALTFIAPANVVRYCCGEPVFIDCEPDTLTIDVDGVEDFLAKECRQKKDGYYYNKKTSRRVKAVIPVHVFGFPADMRKLRIICGKFNLSLIEDATESLGAEYRGKKTGSLSDVGCFSFNGNKIITCGSGGMVVTNDASIAKRIRHLSTQAKTDPFEYDHDDVGFNYRLSNIQAAMGVAQIERLDDFVSKKRANAIIYREMFKHIEGVDMLWEQPGSKSNFWLNVIRVGKKHKEPLMRHLLSAGVQVRPVWKLLNTLGVYRKNAAHRIKHAADAYQTCINIPSSVGLSRQDIVRVGSAIKEYFKNAG